MVIDVGRIKHLGDLMHKSIASNGTAVASNWKLSADGLQNVVWTPEGAGSVSYGSNSNEVSYVNAPGASTLASRADHVHRGVTSLSHASNTYTGPVTLETEGSLYIVRSAANTYRFGATGGSGGSGSGLTHSYLGYNTVGASFETLTSSRQYMKKITVSSAGMLQNVGLYVKMATTVDISRLLGIVMEDSSGVPAKLIAHGTGHNFGVKTGSLARWLHIPVPIYLTAGDYWIGFSCATRGVSDLSIAYDTGGSDPYMATGDYAIDGNYTTNTDSTRKYSIRASILS